MLTLYIIKPKKWHCIVLFTLKDTDDKNHGSSSR